MKKSSLVISWILQLLIAGILLSTLPHKFGGSQESIDLFTRLDMEPHGRYMTGAIELLVCLLILIPGSVVRGAFLGAGVMAGAIIGHITKLGFSGDAGTLGAMAILVFISSLGVLFLRRHQLSFIHRMFGSHEEVK
jgi:hypothetical protein